MQLVEVAINQEANRRIKLTLRDRASCGPHQAPRQKRTRKVAGQPPSPPKGIEQGIEKGRAEERALLCRLAARKFDAAAGRQLAAALAGVTDAGRLAQVGEWIIECGTAAELFARLAEASRRSR